MILVSESEAQALRQLAERTIQRDAALAWVKREHRKTIILRWLVVAIGLIAAGSITVNVFHNFLRWIR